MRLSAASFNRQSGLFSVCRQCFLKISKRQGSTLAPFRRSFERRLPDHPARTRFAPSPTGYLHLGSLRTALFNYLLAKATSGQFLLRLEDTDKKRTVPDAEHRLYDDLKWAGLHWDEGPLVGGPYGPYRQSERTNIYAEHAAQLVKSGHAYRCFCSAERLAHLAEQRNKLGLPTDYDRNCTSIPASESEDRASRGELHVIRFKVPSVAPQFVDLVYGNVGGAKPKRNLVIDAWADPVLLKSDGLPTYNLANVVDDHLMRITHVVRGTEWMAMTSHHLAMYEAFKWNPPQYAHVGLLTEASGAKLSKRTQSTDVRSFRDTGILPEALINFVALLGWSQREKSDVMTLAELENKFDMKFTKGATTVNLPKLEFMQKQHMVKFKSIGNPDALKTFVASIEKALLSEQHINTSNLDDILGGRPLDKYITSIFYADDTIYRSHAEFLTRHAVLFTEPPPAPDKGDEYPPLPHDLLHERILKALKEGDVQLDLNFMCDQLVSELPRSTTESWAVLDDLGDAHFRLLFFNKLRDIIAGGKQGLSMNKTIKILGYHTVKRRFEKYNAAMKARDHQS